LGERERPGPPQLSITIDDTTIVATRPDTIGGVVRAEDFDGIDSVWVTAGATERGADGGFNRVFNWRYRFIVDSGQTPGVGAHIPLSFRTRDAAGFEAQRDTYVVVIP
jgi:hypothetical protein